MRGGKKDSDNLWYYQDFAIFFYVSITFHAIKRTKLGARRTKWNVDGKVGRKMSYLCSVVLIRTTKFTK